MCCPGKGLWIFKDGGNRVRVGCECACICVYDSFVCVIVVCVFKIVMCVIAVCVCV